MSTRQDKTYGLLGLGVFCFLGWTLPAYSSTCDANGKGIPVTPAECLNELSTSWEVIQALVNRNLRLQAMVSTVITREAVQSLRKKDARKKVQFKVQWLPGGGFDIFAYELLSKKTYTRAGYLERSVEAPLGEFLVLRSKLVAHGFDLIPFAGEQVPIDLGLLSVVSQEFKRQTVSAQDAIKQTSGENFIKLVLVAERTMDAAVRAVYEEVVHAMGNKESLQRSTGAMEKVMKQTESGLAQPRESAVGGGERL